MLLLLGVVFACLTGVDWKLCSLVLSSFEGILLRGIVFSRFFVCVCVGGCLASPFQHTWKASFFQGFLVRKAKVERRKALGGAF